MENIPYSNKIKLSLIQIDENSGNKIEIGGDLFSFVYFYNNGAGLPPTKYLLFDSDQESIGTVTIQTTYLQNDRQEVQEEIKD